MIATSDNIIFTLRIGWCRSLVRPKQSDGDSNEALAVSKEAESAGQPCTD
ncbi:hypothetical protein P4H66_27905 [Paenibacillus dokdonensis]|uniref:Uncharacterized protein n=1 Tax=Paenibacillus dokdonensis TaxID=2567944 RepID=A0ABU6GY45_9BACL|nr:hypothetical protein [Paenibacillus dokdonensis]MEC0243640.1 hypothetical protein [Paenibacillus dokdonensis]